MTIGEVNSICGTPRKSWFYSRYCSYNARIKTKAICNKYGTFYFSENTLIAFIPTHRSCPLKYRNRLYVSENTQGIGAMGRHLNLISKDKNARLSSLVFKQILNCAVYDLTTLS